MCTQKGACNVASYQNDKIHFETPKGKVVQRVYTKGKNKGKFYFCIEWSPGFGPRFTQGFTTAQAAFAQEVARMLDRYVPMDTGTLKNSVHIASDYQRGELVYATPYARRQYYLHDKNKHEAGGGRGPYWGRRGAAAHKQHFARFARAAIQKELGK